MAHSHGAYYSLASTPPKRTKADTLYCDKCLAVQKGHRLPDGCPSDAVSKRAIAFVLLLMPNFAQKYHAGGCSRLHRGYDAPISLRSR